MYRSRPSLEFGISDKFAAWGVAVKGVQCGLGDEWLKVGNGAYLPINMVGRHVLLPTHEASSAAAAVVPPAPTGYPETVQSTPAAAPAAPVPAAVASSAPPAAATQAAPAVSSSTAAPVVAPVQSTPVAPLA